MCNFPDNLIISNISVGWIASTQYCYSVHLNFVNNNNNNNTTTIQKQTHRALAIGHIWLVATISKIDASLNCQIILVMFLFFSARGGTHTHTQRPTHTIWCTRERLNEVQLNSRTKSLRTTLLMILCELCICGKMAM